MNPKIWTPRYIKNRILLYLHEKKHSSDPWIAPEAVIALDKMLSKEMKGLEFGSGRSTVWYATRLKHLTSVEDHKGWYEQVSQDLKKSKLDNIDFYFCSSEGVNPKESEYYKILEKFEDASLDLIVVDGKMRNILAIEAIAKLKPGGLLLLDDMERYLPFPTHAPYKIHGRNIEMDPLWSAFKKETEDWGFFHYTSGVSDTGIFVRP